MEAVTAILAGGLRVGVLLQGKKCKQCNAPLSTTIPSSTARLTAPDFFLALGTKRLASEEFVNEWDNKRLIARDTGGRYMTYKQRLYREQLGGFSYDQERQLDPKYSSGILAAAAPVQRIIQHARWAPVPPLLEKGDKSMQALSVRMDQAWEILFPVDFLSIEKKGHQVRITQELGEEELKRKCSRCRDKREEQALMVTI